MPTFNDFLASGDGNLNRDQAEGLLWFFAQHGVAIKSEEDYCGFAKSRPELFREDGLTPDEIAEGWLTTRTIFHRYRWWSRPPYNGPPLRPMRRA